jgi:dimethylaniline monooxygenase (N-oxide forming)
VFPAPEEFFDFMEVRQASQYFRQFQEAHGLEVRFAQKVRELTITSDEKVAVKFTDGATSTFDHAVVCTGANHSKSESPTPSMFREFAGEIVHSDSITNLEQFAGKRVLVKGVGESTIYIVSKLADVAQRIVITCRHGCNLVPRTLAGIPLDMFYFWQMRPLEWKFLHSFSNTGGTNLGQYKIFWNLLRKSGIINGHTIEQFKSRSSFTTEYSIKYFWGLSENGRYFDNLDVMKDRHNFGFAKDIKSARGNEVIFDDGSAEDIDVIVIADGFTNLPNVALPITVNASFYRKLYKGVVHPSLGDKILFNGFTRPNVGSFPQMAEMSSHLVNNIINGTHKLVSKQLYDAIESDNIDHMTTSPLLADRPHIHEYRNWMDRMAELVGRKPRLPNMGLQPVQLLCFFGGPHIAHRYDLDENGRFKSEYIKITRRMFKNSSYRYVFWNHICGAISFSVLAPLSLVMAYTVSPWWLTAPIVGLLIGRIASLPFYRRLFKEDVKDMKQYASFEAPTVSADSNELAG